MIRCDGYCWKDVDRLGYFYTVSVVAINLCVSILSAVLTVQSSYVVAVPDSKVEAVVQSPANMAAADIAAVDFNKLTLLVRPACLRPCLLGKIC